MKIKNGVMGSAEDSSPADLREQATALGRSIAARDVILLTGATTGLVYATGKAAHDAGALHVGISPAHDERDFEFCRTYKIPVVPVIRPVDGELADGETMTEPYLAYGIVENSGEWSGLPSADKKKMHPARQIHPCL